MTPPQEGAGDEDPAEEFWRAGLKTLLGESQKPSSLVTLAYRFLDGLPTPLGTAVKEQAAFARDGSGKPHRAAEARRLLPINVPA